MNNAVISVDNGITTVHNGIITLHNAVIIFHNGIMIVHNAIIGLYNGIITFDGARWRRDNIKDSDCAAGYSPLTEQNHAENTFNKTLNLQNRPDLSSQYELFTTLIGLIFK